MARNVAQAHGGSIRILEKGETANRKGRPPKLATQVIRDLKARGIERVTRAEVDDLIARLPNLSKQELRGLGRDGKNTPAIVAIVARELAGIDAFDAINSLWDREHGKAKQQVDIKAQIVQPPVINVMVHPTPDGG